MKEYIILTGPTAGIGLEMAHILAGQGRNLILIARNEQKCNNLAAQLRSAYQTDIIVSITDLSDTNATAQTAKNILEKDIIIAGLINNAGIGQYGDFAELPIENDLHMINVNINAIIILTKAFLPGMISRGYGHILNMASLLSYIPFPYYSVYSATKAFIFSFTSTLSAELQNSGIRITQICPGPVDTGFNTPEMWNTNAYKQNKPMPAKEIALACIDLMYNSPKISLVPGFINKVIAAIPRFTPPGLMLRIKTHLASQRK
jgi:short-subunit dehydrogenase